ncbi:FecR domain-containing protein [Sulfurimonas sp. SAG-AH-194-C20]|nr:FecR family protein [Sulfurimonas sp. SAG-AH-194-C20]MDF1879330.1 FecR domain-containing protein [Sulfurimonas sp. SAG-AH-194-C20]
MKLILVSVFLGLFSLMYAQSIIGDIESFNGNVKIKPDNSIKKTKVYLGLKIYEGDMIISSKNSSVAIRLVDGSTLVLDELSTLHFSSLYGAEQEKGKILYKITSRNAKNSLKITTPFAVIGIKGTTFIVNATKTSSVLLKEGLIGIQSIHKEFELYRKNEQKKFDDFREKQEAAKEIEMNAFEKFKNTQYQVQKPIKTKEFHLESGHSVSFNGSKVQESTFEDSDDASFEYFDKLIKSMKR